MTRRDYLSAILFVAMGLAASAELGHGLLITTDISNLRHQQTPLRLQREDFIPIRGEIALPPGADL